MAADGGRGTLEEVSMRIKQAPGAVERELDAVP